MGNRENENQTWLSEARRCGEIRYHNEGYEREMENMNATTADEYLIKNMKTGKKLRKHVKLLMKSFEKKMYLYKQTSYLYNLKKPYQR